MRDRNESGFTVIELMTVALIGAILLGLGGMALKQFSRAKALESAHTTMKTQLRAAQQRSFTEGYPRTYGIRFLKGGSTWNLVRYDAAAATCTVVETHRLPDTVVVSTATDFPDSTAATACRSAAPSSANYEVALFHARGSATAGTVTFQLAGTSKTRSITVNGATGRAS